MESPKIETLHHGTQQPPRWVLNLQILPGLAIALLVLQMADSSRISEWSWLVYVGVMLVYFEVIYRFNRRRYNVGGSRLNAVLTTHLETRTRKAVGFLGVLVLLAAAILIPRIVAAY